jgi:hypothetical protein
LVEVNQQIPNRDEACASSEGHFHEPSAASRVFDERSDNCFRVPKTYKRQEPFSLDRSGPLRSSQPKRENTRPKAALISLGIQAYA